MLTQLNKIIIEIATECYSDRYQFSEERGQEAMHIEDFPQSIDNVRVPNIILLGNTGAGKSFFGSGLFGVQDPDEGEKHLLTPIV